MSQKPPADTPSSPNDTEADAEVSTRRRPAKPLIIAGAVAALLAVGLWLSYRPEPGQLQGMVDAREIRITSKVTGRIEAFHVEEGQPVRKGQLLYTITSPEVAAKTEQAQGALAAAQAMESKADEGARVEDIRAAEAQWRRAQAAANLAQDTASRTQRLYQEGVVARQKADEAQANAVASSQAARAARAQYDAAVAGARPQDRAAASGQVRQARGAVAEVDAAAAETRVFAPADGEVGRRLAQPGELVPQGFPVFMLTQSQAPWVTMTVREDQLKGLARGKNIEGHIPALDDRKARFRVAFVAPAGDFATWRATRQSSGFDIKSFEIRAVPIGKIDGLRPGMTILFDWPQ
ncbi:MAG: efflux RND transporter periplasmic adaptor subunit [Sphingopyxis sp.]|uniref:HlyD family secretion protein n=1 Tax=Sphingopyxis sp. TaxID=1908224 RepID=UPI002ABB3C7F|nr:efflux RND transporter periplasmic adaptor subunit [Sphingopyxis sp.]MDZ3832813.1 efflux RND transporter periplasmic adaptor subunit [Sphingopyxis sp.]